MPNNNEKRFCTECGKEITSSARKCKYCGAAAPLDKYEKTARLKDNIPQVINIILVVAIIFFAFSLIMATEQENFSKWPMFRDGSLIVVLVCFYYKKNISLLKQG